MAVVVMRFAGHCVAAACVAAPFCAPRRRPCRGGQPLLSFLGKILRRQARHAGHVHDHYCPVNIRTNSIGYHP
jgi:hypothetical protein